MTRGLFIAFEGMEGAGKSTQVGYLVQHLAGVAGRQVVVTREPGATDVGNRIRNLLLADDPPVDIPPKTEALLYAADRSAHVARVIRPALDRGDIVVTDRYTDSSIAYQGMGRGLGSDIVELSVWATDALWPDLTILLDIDVRTGLARAVARGRIDRIEQEPASFHERVRAGFLQVAANAPRRYLVLDGTRPAGDVAAAVAARVDEHVARLPARAAQDRGVV